MYQGGGNVTTDNYSNLPVIVSAEFNGDATSNIDVMNPVSYTATGDAGDENWEYTSLFKSLVEGDFWDGWIGEFIVFNKQLSAGEKTEVLEYLENKWLNPIDVNKLLGESIAHFDETTIAGTTEVTAWNNKGLGLAPFNLDVIIGVAASLTREVGPKGLDVVNAAGDVGIEATVAQTVPSPMTMFIIGNTSAITASIQAFIGSNNAAAELLIAINAAGDFIADAGAELSISPADTLDHVLTVIHNADGTSSFEVSGISKQVGTIGAESFDFGRLFVPADGVSFMAGQLFEIALFDKVLTDSEVIAIQTFLDNKWIVPVLTGGSFSNDFSDDFAT